MTVSGQFSCPPPGSFVAVSGQSPVAADRKVPPAGEDSSSRDCGNYRADFCDAFLESATTGQLTPELKSLLEASSPASVLDRITAPTLITQGEGDTLLPLAEADANAGGIAANGTPGQSDLVQRQQGARSSEAETRLQLEETAAWFEYYLRGEGDEPDLTLNYTLLEGERTGNQEPQASILQTDHHPGLMGTHIPEPTSLCPVTRSKFSPPKERHTTA